MRHIRFCIMSIFMLLLAIPAHAAVDMSQSRGDVLSYVGSFTESIPIAVAPGRAGMQPALMLQYSSSLGNSLYGFGWNLDITRIERDTRNNGPKYDGTDKYLLVMKGARQALVAVGSNEYRVANENSFLKITRTGSGWEITDRKNTVYSLAAPWPTTGVRQFSWSLSQVVDVNGNRMDYTYADGGQGHRLTSITYGVNQRVDFEYEMRPDLIMSYRSGMRNNITLRLKAVRSYAGTQLSSHIGFSYKPSAPHDHRSLLSKATVFDVDGKLSSRSRLFDYALQNQSAPDGAWDVLYSLGRRTMNRDWRQTTSVYMDVNGDGVVELVAGDLWRSGRSQFYPPFRLPDDGISHYSYVRSNRTYTVQTPTAAPGGFSRRLRTNYRERAFVDMNGDGNLDWVLHAATGKWRIYYHNGTSFNSTYDAWADPSANNSMHALYDINGDGLPDLLSLVSGSRTYWTAYENTGAGFASQGYNVYLSTWPIPTTRV